MARKLKKNLSNLANTEGFDISTGKVTENYDNINNWLDSYGDTVLGDGQDNDAYQEFRSLGDDAPEKWDFVKEYENLTEEEMVDNFLRWLSGEDEDPDNWVDEDHMDERLLAQLEYEDEEPDDSESTDADNINIADFEDEIKESGSDVNKIVERIIDLSKTTDMSSDDVEYMRDVLTQRVKDYLDKKSESTNLGGIAKALTANDLGRSL